MTKPTGGQGGRAKGHPKTRLTGVLFVMAIEELLAGPTTRAELAEHTGLHYCTVNMLITALHKRGLIHIAAWERDARGSMQIAAFQFGSKPDAVKKRKTGAEAARDWRERTANRSAVLASAGVSIQAGA